MKKVTLEEAKRQAEMLANHSKVKFVLDTPLIQEEVKKLQPPLTFEMARSIYRWLFRKQISIEMLPTGILEEFKKTEMFERLIKRPLHGEGKLST